MSDYSEYDQFLNDAAKDDRLGRQTMMVTEVVEDQWPSGDKRLKVKGLLTTGGNAKVDITFSELPSKATIDAESATWSRGKKQGIAQAINFRKALAKIGKSPEKLAVGDEIGVEIVKNKEGWLRVAAILGAPASPSSAHKDPIPGF